MSLFKKGLVTSISTYISMGLGIIQTMILSRALGPEHVGSLSLIRQIALFGAQIGSFGIPMAIIYYINKEKQNIKEVYNTSFIMIQLLSILSCICIYFIFVNTTFLGQYNTVSFIAISLFIFFSNNRSLIQSLNIASQNVKKMSVVEILPMFLTVLALCIYYYFGNLDLNKALYLTVVIWPLIGLISVVGLNLNQMKFSISFNKTLASKILKYGSLINLSDFLIVFNSSITLFLLQYYIEDLKSVGYLARAITLTTLINTAFISLFRLLYSHWSNLEGVERKKSVENVLNILLYISIFSSLIIYIFSKWIIIFLFGNEFLPAKDLVNIMIFGASFYLISKALLKLFISDGNSRYNIISLTVGALSNLFLSMILITSYGLIGAAYAQLLSGILFALTTLIISRSKYNLSLMKIFLPRKTILNLKNYIRR